VYPVLRETLLDFMQWALPILAGYGIYQLVRPPVWDTTWMQAAEVWSIGAPVPFGFRIFGTMNTPGPYAVALVVGMLYLLASGRRAAALILPVCLVALMLTRVRSSWVALLAGLLVVQFLGPLRKSARNWVVLALMLLLSVPLLSLDVFRDTISRRLQSFASISQDDSFKQRVIFSAATARVIAEQAEGEGLGATGGSTKLQGTGRAASIDNGFLEVFYTLGWPGGAFLVIGLLGHLVGLARYRDAREDSFANGARASFWGVISVLLLGDIFSGSIGTMFWGALGFASCAHAYNFATGRALRSQQVARELAARSARPSPTPVTPPMGVGVTPLGPRAARSS
jgi:hypothetical protein